SSRSRHVELTGPAIVTGDRGRSARVDRADCLRRGSPGWAALASAEGQWRRWSRSDSLAPHVAESAETTPEELGQSDRGAWSAAGRNRPQAAELGGCSSPGDPWPRSRL